MASVNALVTVHRVGQRLPSGASPIAPDHKKPAILTQTIADSPIVKFILPARLRNSERNDVVFVGTNTVQVKEALPEGRLLDVTKKTDFTGTIMGAKVLNVTEELAFNPARPNSSWNGPAQILVLAVDMKELQFVYIPPEDPNEFVTFSKALPRDVSADIQYGKHLAVDPKSRAVAVSATQDYVGILKLKSPSEIQSGIERGTLNPIEKESYFEVDGTILSLEFLYPQNANDKAIILLLILQRDELTYARTYKWDQDDMLGNREPVMHEFRLRRSHRMPTMIVPLTKKASFLVVSTQEIAVYSSDNSTRPRNYPFLAPATDVSAASIWTRWARPARNWLYNQRHDGIYLCREDGWVYLFEFGNEGDLENQVSLGQIYCDVDMAFDVLDMGHEGGDFILAAGSTGDAGFFIQEARASPKRVQQFLNWAPVRDATLVSSSFKTTAQGGIARNRLFACTESSAGGGALHEFRWGIEGTLEAQVQFDDFSSIRDMWAMIDRMGQSIYILISEPTSTLLIQADFSLENMTALNEDQTGLSSDPTLAAGFVKERVLVQATEQEIRLFYPQGNRCVWHMDMKEQGKTVLAAAVHESASIIAMAYCEDDRVPVLRVDRVVVEQDSSRLYLAPGNSQILDKEPICVVFEEFGGLQFVFLGNQDGTITTFLVQNGDLTKLFETSIDIKNDTDFSTVVESLAVIKVKLENELENDTVRAFLLCGLRSGFLVPFEIDFDGNKLIDLKQKEISRIGTTSVRARSMGPYAMLLCGGELWHVAYNPDCIPAECVIQQVWVTDRNNPASFPTEIFGFGVLSPPIPEPWMQLGPLLCFTHQQLLVCQLNQDPKIVPRRIELPGRPKRLTYSPTLQCLITSYETLEVENMDRPLQKTTRSFLKFVDPDSQSEIIHGPPEQHWTPTSTRGETVTCIFDWPCESKGHKYHFVAIGTRLRNKDEDDDLQDAMGRVVVLTPRRDLADPSKIKITSKLVHGFDHQVSALANHGTALVVASGDELSYLPLEGSTKPPYPGKLTSPAVSLTVRGDDVFVMTSRHSWMIFRITVQDDGAVTWRNLYSDDTMRGAVTHVVHPANPAGQSICLMSFRGGRVEAERMPTPLWEVINVAIGDFGQPACRRSQASLHTNIHESILRFFPQTEPDGPFYGITMQGTIIRFTVPNPNEADLLKLLQNICTKDEILTPSLRRWRRRKLVYDLTKEGIDGDLLARLAARGPNYLERLVGSIASISGDSYAEDAFNQIAPLVVGSASFEAVIGWLRRLLKVSL